MNQVVSERLQFARVGVRLFATFPSPGRRRISERQWKNRTGGGPKRLEVSSRNGVHSNSATRPRPHWVKALKNNP